MESIKILILDDEAHCHQVIQHQLSKTNLANATIMAYTDPVEAVAYIKSHPIDLLFLDIDMPILNGFDFLEQLEEVDFNFIIVTAYDHFALQAIKASAIDYLLKPVPLNDLIEAVDKFEERFVLKDKSQSQIFKQNIQVIQQNIFDKLVIPTMSGFILEEFGNINAFEADGEYTLVLLKDNEKILVSKSLGHFEKSLPDDQFLRIHRKHIVNVSKIRYVGKDDGGLVRLINGQTFAVSRSKYELVKALFSS